MSDFMPKDGITNGSNETPSTDSVDVVELRLPPKDEYLPVIRAAAGVLAGGLSFNYDEVIQLRTAVAEAFELMFRRTLQGTSVATPLEITVRFTITSHILEVFFPTNPDVTGQQSFQGEVESKALLESLVDEVELDGEAGGAPSIRLVKYRPAVES